MVHFGQRKRFFSFIINCIYRKNLRPAARRCRGLLRRRGTGGGRCWVPSPAQGWRNRGANKAELEPRRWLGLRYQVAMAIYPLLLPRLRVGVQSHSRNLTLPFLSCFTWPGMWLYFVLPTFAFPKGGNERASVPPIYCASREPHGCRKSRCLLLNLACCYVNLLPALMSPINTPCVSNKLAFLSLELLKADLCQICPWARPGVRWE